MSEILILPAGHPLKTVVTNVFHARDAMPPGQHILPRGIVEVLFNFGDRVEASEGCTATIPASGVVLAGAHTMSFRTAYTGRMEVFGVALRMEAAASVLRVPQDEILDRLVDAQQVLPEANELMSRLAEARSFDARVGLVFHWIRKRIRTDERQALMTHACRALRCRPSDARVGELSRDLGMSARHFQRIFTSVIGVTPSRYVRLSRFVRSLDLIPRAANLAEAAHAAHYTDQSHFCHDFREFAGITPDEYRRRVGPMPHLLPALPLRAASMSDSYKANPSAL